MTTIKRSKQHYNSSDIYLQAMGIERWVLREEESWSLLQKQVAACQQCPLHETRTNTVFGAGFEQAELFIVGEAPGFDEDQQGKPFVGRAGVLLDNMLRAIGLQSEQVFISNVIKCRPPQNRDPKVGEVAQCGQYLQAQIEYVKPKLVLALGRYAAQYLLNTTALLAQLRGKQHKIAGDVSLIVSYHPAYLLRKPEDKAKAMLDWLSLKAALVNHES